ncbi:hypothetical protein DM01DRAFT_362337 [Hesseltinella vesiculosa]|uniref:SEC7 domain-containing protein n=1 Tax=Hesseltinella vesiculosa TaxID=101127 RepID=A0A1X2G7N7_9FUNG|nr:hypothetical protein DM01DRAFT_362337 [Hesseltinella vesiculosa]
MSKNSLQEDQSPIQETVDPAPNESKDNDDQSSPTLTDRPKNVSATLPPPLPPHHTLPKSGLAETQDDFKLQYHSYPLPHAHHAAPCAPIVPRSSSLDVRRTTSVSPPPSLLRSVNTIKHAQDDLDDSSGDDLDEEAVKRLSKRLSGGHFGSAGGLIYSTLSLQQLQQDISPSTTSTVSVSQQDTSPPPSPTSVTDRPSKTLQPSASSSTSSHRAADKSTTPPPPQHADHLDHPSPCPVINDPTPPTPHLPEPMPLLTVGANPAVPVVVDAAHPLTQPTDAIGVVSLPPSCEPDASDALSTHSTVEQEFTSEEYAQRLWQEDEVVYTDDVAEWLGNGSPESAQVLERYLAYFDFTDLHLEDALRYLCSKVPLKAESQQIDRILHQFSKRYHECHPASAFGTSDVIHAIVYSLILLNTDLHVAQGERKKMSRSAFVRNTMDGVRAQLEDLLPSTSLETQNPLLDQDKFASCVSLTADTPDHGLKRASSLNASHALRPLQPVQHPTQARRLHQRTAGSSSLDLSRHPLGSRAWESEMGQLLKQMYTSIRHQQIALPGSRLDTKKRSGVGNRLWKSTRDSLFIGSDSNSELDYGRPPMTPRSTMSSISGAFSRRRSISSMRSGYSHHSQHTQGISAMAGLGASNYQAVASMLHHPDLPMAFTSSAPYYKEGMIARKHLLEEANRRARTRDWKECFMVVDRGQLRMYRLDQAPPHRRKEKPGVAALARHPLQGMKSRSNQLPIAFESQLSLDQTVSSITSDVAMGAGDWVANAQLIGDIDLKHTLCNALPSGYSRQRRFAFALQQANGGVYLFQVGSQEQVHEWVATCNYWAARESKEPLMGGIGSLEYGWGSDLMEDDSTDPPSQVYEWEPSIPPLVPSTLGELAQLEALQHHIHTLNEELDRHRDLKQRIQQRFPKKNSQRVCAMTNFENKNQYLLHEIIKYQNYCDALEQSLSLQVKALPPPDSLSPSSSTQLRH